MNPGKISRCRSCAISCFSFPPNSPAHKIAPCSDSDEFESVGGRFVLQGGQFALLAPALKLCGSAIDPCLSVSEQPVNQTGQITGHGFNGFGSTEACSQKTISGAQITVTPQQGLRRSP